MCAVCGTLVNYIKSNPWLKISEHSNAIKVCNGIIVQLLSRNAAHFILISFNLSLPLPPLLSDPTSLKDVYTSLEEVLPQTDVLYMTRIQKERFSSPNEYEEVGILVM